PRVIAPGVVRPRGGEIELATEVPGLLAEVLVKEGDEVAAGQALARLDDGGERARVEAAKARLKAAEASQSRAKRGSRPEEKSEAAATAEAARARATLSREAYEREVRLLEK